MGRDQLVRSTSIAAYKALVESGALPRMRRRVWQWLFYNGPATRNEVARGIKGVPNDVSTRLRELASTGNVCIVGEDTCCVSGRNVILYDVTAATVVGPCNGHNKRRPDPVVFRPERCGECPLVVISENDTEVCFLDQTMEVDLRELPESCRLNERDFVIRGRAQKRS